MPAVPDLLGDHLSRAVLGSGSPGRGKRWLLTGNVVETRAKVCPHHNLLPVPTSVMV